MLTRLRASLASLALQIAVAAFNRAMKLHYLSIEDRKEARSVAMSVISRDVGFIRGKGTGYTVDAGGVARAALATGAAAAVSGTAAVGTLGFACMMVGGGL